MADEQTTDDQILSNVPGIEDETTDTTTTDTQTTDTTTTTATETPQTTTPSDTTTQGDGTQPKDQQTRGPSDLIGADGQVIAKGGPERRHYENLQKSRSENQTLTTELTTLRAKVEAFEKSGGLGQQHSLSPEELATGAHLMSSWKSDPSGTAKYLLTQAQALGHNVEGFGGTDVGAMKSMMETMLAPFISERQERVDTQAATDDAKIQYDSFISMHPDAQVHNESIARLLGTDKSLSLEAAYFKLRSFYLERGLDWNKPLDTLQQEQKTAAPAQGGTQQQLPSGNVSVSTVTDDTEIAAADTSFDDIIRQSMQEAGLKLN